MRLNRLNPDNVSTEWCLLIRPAVTTAELCRVAIIIPVATTKNALAVMSNY
jgi:hypothetical protein